MLRQLMNASAHARFRFGKARLRARGTRPFHTTSKTVAKWVDRFSPHGLEGLRHRSSRPHSLPSKIPLATADARWVAVALKFSTRSCRDVPASESAPV